MSPGYPLTVHFIHGPPLNGKDYCVMDGAWYTAMTKTPHGNKNGYSSYFYVKYIDLVVQKTLFAFLSFLFLIIPLILLVIIYVWF